ncbi:hypothetical protein F5Y19DRAFT_489801 [Xylariaceae sp. FL1651]|nr:hypothetical protein F5Y19DRAFT_489801 [Xylariaceae sp. FL1651]
MDENQNDIIYNDLENFPWSQSTIDDVSHSPAPWAPADPAAFPNNNAADADSEVPTGFLYGPFEESDFNFHDFFNEVPAGDQNQPAGVALEGSNTITEQLPRTSMAEPRTTRRVKARGPPASSWFAHRGNIKRLYIDEDKTLEETRKLMKEKYNFDATPQMYKEKFGDWGFSKYISRKVAAKLCRVADDRKPKDTKFCLGQKAWSVEDMKRKVEKSNRDDAPLDLASPVLPVELHWRTPSLSPSMQNAFMARKTPNPPSEYPWMPSLLCHETSPSLNLNHGRPWSPFTSNAMQPPSTLLTPTFNHERRQHNQGYFFPSQPPPRSLAFPWVTSSSPRLRLNAGHDPLQDFLSTSKWHGKSLRDLQGIRLDSLKLESEGKTNEAASNLRFVVAGLNSLLAPTHDATKAAAYDLARILGGNNDMDEANSILSWMNSTSVKKYGLRSKQTVIHYIKVIDLLRSWSRDEDPELLLYKIAELWTQDDADAVPAIPDSMSAFAMPASLPETDIAKLFQKPASNEDDIGIQLRLIEVLLPSQAPSHLDLEGIIKNLLGYCERNGMLMPSVHARCCLSKFYGTKGLEERGKDILAGAVPMIEHHFRVTESVDQKVLRSCRELAFRYFELGSRLSCEDILEMTADFLEFRTPVYEGSRSVINFLVSIGLEWQKRLSWESAAPWFERALLNSMNRLGNSDCMTRILEKTLEEKRFVLQGEENFEFDLITSYLRLM